MELYQQEQTREGAGGNSATQVLRQEEEISYQKKAELLLNDENCYKFIVVSVKFSMKSHLLCSFKM
jgi:paired amphipathic helix protein Sin3a